MAGFLIVNGVDVEIEEARRLEPVNTGEFVRAYDRTGRSTRHATNKREWSMTTRPLTVPEQATIRTACAFGSLVSVGGSALGFSGSGTLTCVIEEGQSDYLVDGDDTVYGWQAPLTLTLREV